jgi:hypothetical protein
MNTAQIDRIDDQQAIASKTLAHLGYLQPQQTLAQMRQHVARHGQEPRAAVRALMHDHRLLCLGEKHDYAGRYMAAELVSAAAQGGARWLFVEVYDHEQAEIDTFSRSGFHQDLPVSTGGGCVTPMRFQQPYVEMLLSARHAGMRIVAVDRHGVSYDQRNECMALAVARHLRNPADRGVVVVGHLHLVPRSLFGRPPLMATLLREELGGGVVTIARAVPGPAPNYSVWADVAGVSEPCLMPVAGSPFELLGATYGRETMRGADFDHLFFYPAAAVFDAQT